MKMIRYCYECGHVGPVGPSHINCCPDGIHAVEVPVQVAHQARAGFLACLAGQAAAPEGAEAEFELYCYDQCAAGTSGPREQAWAEIQRYAAQYAQDGPITIYEVTRRIATPPGAAPARAPAAAIPDAIRKLIGTPDDPNIGWRGDGTNEVYACEFCNAKHGDCTKIPHTKNCPVPAAFAALASAPAGAGEGASPTLPADCITVNLVRLAGLDKHKARECDAIVRQVLASRAAGEPAVAAQKGTIGHVGNGKTTLVGALAPILAPAVAAADEGRDYEQTLWLRELFALIEKWHGTRDGTPSKAESFDALWKHAHNIGPHWRARAASQDEHQEKQG